MIPQILAVPMGESRGIFVYNPCMLFVILLLLLGGCEKKFSRGETFDVPATSLKATDGDSLKLFPFTKLRLWRIDAPELEQICYNPNPYPCGELSQRVLQKLLKAHSDETLRCVVKLAADAYNRPHVQCALDGHDVAKHLVQHGYAISLGRDYKKAQNQAKKHNRGLWAGCFARPKRWRQQKFKPTLGNHC